MPSKLVISRGDRYLYGIRCTSSKFASFASRLDAIQLADAIKDNLSNRVPPGGGWGRGSEGKEGGGATLVAVLRSVEGRYCLILDRGGGKEGKTKDSRELQI